MSRYVAEGGCQCGAVRYGFTVAPGAASFCHCRMCQRAVGNVFGAFSGAHKDQFVWIKGEPTFYASSTVATRGFCRDCGTPLSFAYNKGTWCNVTLGSLDDPNAVSFDQHHGIESKWPSLTLCDGALEEPTQLDERADGFVNLQERLP